MAGAYASTPHARQCGPFTCRNCRTDYYAKRPDRNKYCSRECAFAAKREAKEQKLTAAERNRLIKKILALLRQVAKIRRLAELSETPCVVCGNPCGYIFGRVRKYCGRSCRNKSDRYIAAHRVQKAKRRARERGLEADSIDPIKVFERDGWRCHICNKKLRRADRGSCKASAPELDHIIALADGGTHTHGNVACACRACNIAKGATSFGQLGLGIAA